MNKKIKSFKEFENRFKNQTLPEVQHKAFLATKAIEHKRGPVFLRASFMSVFLTLCITASIAAAMQFTGWKFFNSEGKQVYEMKTMTEEEAEPHNRFNELYAKSHNKMEVIKHKIPEGEFKFFMTVEAYEELGLTALISLSNETEIKSVAQIPDEFTKPLLLKDNLRNKYELTEGTIAYGMPYRDLDASIALAEEMYLEAKENNVEFIEKDGGFLTTEIRHVSLKYKGKEEVYVNPHYSFNRSFQLIISPASESLHTTENLEEYTQFTEGGVDFLLNEETQSMYFIKEYNSKKLLFTIFYSAMEEEKYSMKEEVLEFVKSILE